METKVTITTIREDGTPFGFEMEVGELAQAHVLRKFNPTDNKAVDATKILCAAIIQQMYDLENKALNAATTRATEKAIEMAETLETQAVKANFVQA